MHNVNGVTRIVGINWSALTCRAGPLCSPPRQWEFLWEVGIGVPLTIKITNITFQNWNSLTKSSSGHSSSSSIGYYLLAGSSIWVMQSSWRCGQTQHKAATISQLACLSYSLHVQCSGTDVLPWRDEGSGKPDKQMPTLACMTCTCIIISSQRATAQCLWTINCTIQLGILTSK